MAKVLIGMSGGVDSSVAALLLKEQGHDVTGCTLLLRSGDGCGTDSDVQDAKKVCDILGIKHIAPDMTELFTSKVVNKFTDDYRCGRTPNPCVECNRYIKFGAMLDYALANGFDHIATGHYAAIKEENGTFALYSDGNKDQSYFLYRLTQHELSHTLFPLSGMDKDEIRSLALRAGLPVHAKRDSQDVCFIPDGNVAGFLSSAGCVMKEGNITDSAGNILGRHPGAVSYTVGQRKGLGGGFPTPMFVLSTDMDTNTVVIGKNEQLFYRTVVCSDACFISGQMPDAPFHAQVKLRFGAKKADALLTPCDNGDVTVLFDEPQRAPTPGQSAVFYDGDRVLGGATIKYAKEG